MTTMTNTSDTVQKLNEFRIRVQETMRNREFISFNLNSISIDNERLSLNNEVLTEAATKKVLSQLKVKNNFLEIHKHLSNTDWGIVKEKLKSAAGEQIIHARKVNKGDQIVIDDIYMAAPKNPTALETDSIFNEIIDAIVSTAKDISIKESIFLEDKDEICLTLLENNNLVDIFDNELDMWKTGKRIVWNGMNFQIAPFFERLVCSNGNTAPQYGFKSNISNNKFNLDKIRKILEREITYESESIREYLVNSTNHLKSCNVSIEEFLKYKDLYDENDDIEIINKYFDDTVLNKAYGCIVSDMPSKWKTTADSGKNAYEFFNDVTYTCSHPAEHKMEDRKRLELQIKISDLLFKPILDLEQTAPKVKVTWN